MSTANIDTRSALLRCVLEDPEDDGARLVYADWLEENGNEVDRLTSELIRVQITLADRKKYLTPDQWCDHENDDVADGEGYLGCHECGLRRRERELLLWTPIIAADFPIPASSSNSCSAWRRGFIEEMWVNHDNFIQNARDMFSQHPIRKVTLLDREPAYSASIIGYRWYAIFPYGETGLPGTRNVVDTRLLKIMYPAAPPFHHVPSTQAAQDMLSAACVQFGRSLAGLSPLPVMRACLVCGGTGTIATPVYGDLVPCKACKETGKIRIKS